MEQSRTHPHHGTVRNILWEQLKRSIPILQRLLIIFYCRRGAEPLWNKQPMRPNTGANSRGNSYTAGATAIQPEQQRHLWHEQPMRPGTGANSRTNRALCTMSSQWDRTEKQTGGTIAKQPGQQLNSRGNLVLYSMSCQCDRTQE